MDKVILQKHYDVLKSPVITEKATLVAQSGQLAFEVRTGATKAEIKSAVEAIYKVKVESVNTVNISGKTKRFKGFKGVRNNVRKAYVKLAKDAKIDVMAGV
jgi:large subunit ribosomal protein L23